MGKEATIQRVASRSHQCTFYGRHHYSVNRYGIVSNVYFRLLLLQSGPFFIHDLPPGCKE